MGIIGELQIETKDYDLAELSLKRSLGIFKIKNAPEYTERARILSAMGRLYWTLGRYRDSESAYLRCLRIHEQMPGERKVNLLKTLNSLGDLYEWWRRYPESERVLRRIVDLAKEEYGPADPEYGWALHRLAYLHHQQGRFDDSVRTYQEALQVLEKRPGVSDPDVAMAFVNLGAVHASQRRYETAETLYQRGLRLIEQWNGKGHRYLSTVLNNLAVLHKSQNRLEDVEGLYLQSIKITEMAFGAEDPHLVPAVSNLADFYLYMGRYPQAASCLFRSLRLREKDLSPSHAEVTAARTQIAALYLNIGKPDAAGGLLEQVTRSRLRQVQDVQGDIAVQAALDYGRREEAVLTGAVLDQRALPATRELLMASTLLRKGLALDAAARAQRAFLSTTDARLRQRVAEWQALRQQRDALLLRGRENLSPTAYGHQLHSLGLELLALEAQLAADIPGLQAKQELEIDQVVGLVTAKLPANGVLVEVVWTTLFRPGRVAPDQIWDAPHYVALLLFPDRRVVPIDLGEAAVVDRLVRTLLGALSSPSTNPVTAAQSLYRQALAPLFAQLGDQSHVYLSLDGMLNLIPFDALHDGHDYLLGRYRFHYVSSGRDLLRVPASQAPTAPLVLGNPVFGGAVGSEGPAGTAKLYQRLQGLSPLPGTQREVEAIAKLLGVSAKTQHAAREEVMHAAHAPRILHIATHGLFLPTEDLLDSVGPQESPHAAGQPVPSRSNIIAVPFPDRPPPVLGPMHRAALVLSDVANGASAPGSNRDGLITADEARGLDLYGTQLVVLSACETGQGEPRAGQGIYGLRRAFLVAGAETLVSSLWQISDEATGELMLRYYRKLLDRNKPGDRVGAMIEAMQEMRKLPGREHPYYWAPFLVIGQDGQLRN